MTPRRLALVQGCYYLATGIWPLVSLATFEAVTGPKRDDWLVRTVGLLAIASGAVLVGRSRGDAAPVDVGAATAMAFGAASLWYGGTGRISRVYLADAVAEAGFIALWAALAANGDTRRASIHEESR